MSYDKLKLAKELRDTIQHHERVIGLLRPCDNPQTVEVRLKFEGEMSALQEVLNMIRGGIKDLSMLRTSS